MTTGPIAKLVISGTIDAIQTWSVGITCEAETAPTSAQLTSWLNTVQANVGTWWNATGSVKTINKPTCSLTQIAAYGYANVGQAATGVAVLGMGGTYIGSGTVYTPTQCAVVATFRTPTPGRHNVGRIYLPATGLTLGSTNRLGAGLAQTLATATAALLTSLSTTTINGTTTAAVIVPSSGASASTYVSTVTVGDIVDTQRRRRDQYVETKYSHTV